MEALAGPNRFLESGAPLQCRYTTRWNASLQDRMLRTQPSLNLSPRRQFQQKTFKLLVTCEKAASVLTPPLKQLTLAEPKVAHNFVKAFAPATVANLGPGFDFLGCAVDGLGDFVTAEVFEKYVNSWIAVTAPFQGAPGFIMDCLLTGVEFVKGWQRELFVAKWSMHQLVRIFSFF